jgi:hypothetical protein
MRSPLLSAFLVFLAAACSRAPVATGPSIVQQGDARPHGRVTDHVIVISIDGLRPDAIAKFDAKTIRRLMREGR